MDSSSPLETSLMHSKKSKPSAQNHPFKRKHGKTGTTSKRKLLNKRPTRLQCKTVKNEENVDLEKPLIKYKRRRPMKVYSATIDRTLVVEHGHHIEKNVGIEASDKVVEFKDVKNLEDFKIVVDGLVIDSEIPAQVRSKYYHLCMSQDKYLHNNLIKGLNRSLVAGLIIGAVDVSDALREVELTTSLEELMKWGNSLKLCEDMGMQLGFLRERFNNMIALYSEHKNSKVIHMMSKGARVEEELRKAEAELVKVKRAIAVADGKLKALEKEITGSAIAIKEVASAPW